MRPYRQSRVTHRQSPSHALNRQFPPRLGASGAPAPALGAQAGEARLCHVLHDTGLTQARRATETPFNPVIEAKP